MKFSIQTDSQSMETISHIKLHDIFISKLDEICSDKPSNRESRILAWKSLLNKHGCILVLESHMAEEFNMIRILGRPLKKYGFMLDYD